MIVVTGSGRSGTSAVAQMLHNAGLSAGHDLIPADEWNAEGYFEERPLIELNDAILNDCGLNAWFATASRAEVLAAARARGEAMRALAAQATAVWKDPRFCWTLEAWLEVLPERPRVVVCLRSVTEVVGSTLRYYGQEGDEARRAVEHVWRSEYERLLEVIEAHRLPAICIEYSALHRRPEREARALARFVGQELDISSVRRDLRHHAAKTPPQFAELYERVRALGRRRVTARRPARGGAR